MYNNYMKKIRYNLLMPKELKDELTTYATKYNMTTTAMCIMCIRSGLNVLKVALSADYVKVMEVLAKEYESKEH